MTVACYYWKMSSNNKISGQHCIAERSKWQWHVITEKWVPTTKYQVSIIKESRCIHIVLTLSYEWSWVFWIDHDQDIGPATIQRQVSYGQEEKNECLWLSFQPSKETEIEKCKRSSHAVNSLFDNEWTIQPLATRFPVIRLWSRHTFWHIQQNKTFEHEMQFNKQTIYTCSLTG